MHAAVLRLAERHLGAAVQRASSCSMTRVALRAALGLLFLAGGVGVAHGQYNPRPTPGPMDPRDGAGGYVQFRSWSGQPKQFLLTWPPA